MSKWKMAVALLALAAFAAWPVALYSQTNTQDGQSSRGVMQGTWTSNMDPTDSTGAVDRGTKTQGKWVYQTNAANLNQRWEGAVYYDTLNTYSRQIDSTASLIYVGDVKSIAVHLKVEGMHGDTATVFRVAIIPRWFNSATYDSVSGWGGAAVPNARAQIVAAGDSITVGAVRAQGTHALWGPETIWYIRPFTRTGQLGQSSITVSANQTLSPWMVRTTTINLSNPGAKYLGLYFVVLSTSNAVAASALAPGRFRLRVDVQDASL